MDSLQINYLPTEKLKPYEKNARHHDSGDVSKIAASIKEFGFDDPIGIWSDKNIIVEGHGRYLAAKSIGMTEVPCIRLDHLTDEQRRAYALAHNKTAENSSWDIGLLESELEGILDIDMSDFGFGLEGLKEPAEIEEDEAPEPPEEPKSRQGDLYILGGHRLLCGDATKKEDVERLMGGEAARLYLTDPPYNVDYEGGTGMKIMNDSMSDEKFRTFLKDSFTNACSAMKPGAAFYIWHADSEGYNFRGACKDAGLSIRQCLIWVKNALVMGKQDYQWRHEPCLYGWKEGEAHTWNSDRKQTTVLEFDKPTRNDLHPTMKPVGMIAYQVMNSTHKDDVVLDTFGGSGTTLVASEQTGRRCFTMELDPRYVDVIVERYTNLKGSHQDVLLERDGNRIPYSEVFA